MIDTQVKQFQGQVPTPDMKAGDFSFGGLGNPIFDPASTSQLPTGAWTRTAFLDNRIPLTRMDPVARAILGVDPWKAVLEASPYGEGSIEVRPEKLSEILRP